MENQTRSNNRRETKRQEFLLMASRLTERQDGSGLINCYCFAELTSSSGHKQCVRLSQTHLNYQRLWSFAFSLLNLNFYAKLKETKANITLWRQQISETDVNQSLIKTRTNQANVTFCPHFLSCNKKKLR